MSQSNRSGTKTVYGLTNANELTEEMRKVIYSYSFLLLQFAGSSWDELQHIRQAVGFLVRFFTLCHQANIPLLFSYV